MIVSRRFILASLACGIAAPALAQSAPVAARIGNIPVLGVSPIFVADREGWLKDAGIAASFTTFESGPNMIQALASGTIDVYVAGVAPLAVARARGINARVVAATAIEEMTFVATPKLARFFEPDVPAAEAFKRYRAATGTPAAGVALRLHDARPRALPPSRQARCPTPPCNIGCGRWARSTRPT